MPIDLTTPYTIGEMDPNASYSKFEITSYMVDLGNKTLSVTGVFKKWVDPNWVTGKVPSRTYTVTGSDFDTFIADNLSTYDAVKAALYSKVQELDSRIVGTLT